MSLAKKDFYFRMISTDELENVFDATMAVMAIAPRPIVKFHEAMYDVAWIISGPHQLGDEDREKVLEFVDKHITDIGQTACDFELSEEEIQLILKDEPVPGHDESAPSYHDPKEKEEEKEL